MPSILIEVNGSRVTTIDLAGMQVVDVAIHGGLDGENKATLSAMGGNYADGACGHLIWIDQHALLPGHVVCFKLQEDCANADRGQTLEELYPNEEATTNTDFTISDAMDAELRARPRLHDEFIAQVETSSGERITAVSDNLNTNFRFGLLWDWLHPDRARMRLATYCFDDVIAGRGGQEHVETLLAHGEQVSFSLIR